jgi:hypothetical protein
MVTTLAERLLLQKFAKTRFFSLDSFFKIMQSNITKDIQKRFWWLPGVIEEPGFAHWMLERWGFFRCTTF